MRSSAVRFLISITWIVLSFEQTTNSLPSGDNLMSFGLAPTAMTPVTRLERVSITLTDLLAPLLTNKVSPSGENASSYGLTSTGIRVSS